LVQATNVEHGMHNDSLRAIEEFLTTTKSELQILADGRKEFLLRSALARLSEKGE
jgi:hypothetical protein